MQIAVLHLSDIHLREIKEENSVLTKFDNIIPAVRSEVIGMTQFFIVISGDIAFSGKETEYLHSIDALEALGDACASELGVRPDFVMIPGNHDCNFSVNDKVRDIILEDVRKRSHKVEQSIIDQCCNPQLNYFKFANMYETFDRVEFQDKLFTSKSFVRDDVRIVFHQLNTSWTSELHEKPGQMIFPIENYLETFEHTTGDLIITMLHHPYNWFQPENARQIRSTIERYSDLVLTGHEHVTTVNQQDNLHGQHVEHIEGGVLQESRDPDVSEFNLLRFDLHDGIQKIMQFHWDKHRGIYLIKSTSDWMKVKRSDWLHTNKFQIREDFRSYLRDPGLTLNHPRKTKLTLDDTFVFPDGKLINRTERADALERYVSLEGVFSTFHTENKYMIIGDEKSGKSTLCKVLYQTFYESGFVPIMIDGSQVHTPGINEFEKLVVEAFGEQYGQTWAEEFRQLQTESKVIIIDNLDKSRLNSKFQYQFVNQVDLRYKHVILTGSSLFQFMELMTSEDDGGINSHYQKFELLEFGHKLRFDLIDKWNKLGREHTIDNDELLRENDRVSSVLDTVLGYNFIPAYPFFLLVLIQTIESGVQHNLRESSYGYYYDFLITQEFMRINLRHEEIDAFYNYVTELAFQYYLLKTREITEEQFRGFNTQFGRDYELTYDFNVMASRLEEASIIEKSRNVYRFRYPYIYYYFVAKYLANNISDEQIRVHVSNMCEKVHMTEFANIIMFLTHMSKDPFILSEIVSHAREIFADIVPTKLEHDISPINSLIDTLPRLVYESVDVNEHRQKRLIARDELERANEEVAVESDDEDSVNQTEEIDIVAKLNSAFKSLEILGQILKNYYGSIKGDDKFEICKEAYDLGLRSLNSFLTVLGNNLDAMVGEVEKIIDGSGEGRGKNIDRQRIDRVSRRFVFNLTVMIAYQFIRKISTSIGTKNLMETFRRILSENSSVSVRLIDISLRLEYLQLIPFAELEDFKRVTKGNALGYTLSRALVLNHMYMFNVPYKDKQRVSSLLDIPIARQRSIDLLSRRKKS